MKRGLKHFWLLLAFAVAFAGTGVLGKGDEAPVMPPPMAISQEVSTFAGRPVAIALTAGGRIVEPLDFVIRRPPQRGQLGEIRRTGRNTAAVVYTPDENAGVGGDSFTFAVQSFDSPVSAAARIRIAVREEPPVPVCPREIDFGTVYLGQRSVLPLVLRNDGGGFFSGSIKVAAPWSVEGAGGYRIAGGAKAVVPLAFAPSEERDFTANIAVGADPRAAVVLRGRGLAPVTWPSQGITVGPAERKAQEISLELTNRSPEPRTVVIEWPDFVRAPREIMIPAGGNETVRAAVSPDPAFSFNGTVELRSGGFSGRLPLRVCPVPPVLEIVSGRELDLGAVKSGRSAHGRFTVKNVGGADARLRVTTARELNISPDPASLILSPGREQAFEVQLEAGNGAGYSGTISIAADSGSVAEILVKASFAEKVPASKADGPALPVARYLQTAPVPPSDADAPAGSIPPVEAVSLLHSGPHAIEVAWKETSPDIADYRIERRKILPGETRSLRFEWVPWPEVRVQIRDGVAFARFERMPADEAWTFRITALDAAGKLLSRSMGFRIFTQPAPPRTFPVWVFAAAPGLVLAALIARALQRRRSRLAKADDARIARLGKC